MAFRLLLFGMVACLLADGSAPSLAATAPGESLAAESQAAASLAAKIAAAPPGATIQAPAGIYRIDHGPLILDKPVTLLGRPGAILDGGGQGTVVLIKASHVTFQDFTVRGSGSSLDQEDAGIKVLGSSEQILDNKLHDVLFGIYLKASDDSRIAGNLIIGKPLPLPIRGDSIRLWYSMNCRIEHNTVFQTRDMVLWFSKNAAIDDNRFADSRYGLHLMYDRDVSITGNTLRHDFVGAFLMYSWNVTFERNLLLENRGVSGYGLGVKNINHLLARDNRFLDNSIGIFMSSSPSSLGVTNIFQRNVVAFNDVGISLDPSNQGSNIFTENTFLENLQQVSNSAGGRLDGDSFARNGHGNFWSDYTGYPRPGSGVGAVPYQVSSLFDNLTDQYERLELFRFSPAVEAINFAAAAFPMFRPQVVMTDPDPLISPVPVDAPPLSRPSGRSLALASALLFTLAGLLAAAVFGIPGRRHNMEKEDRTMNRSSHPLLEARLLQKKFGNVEILRRINLSVERGAAVALWGDNGAGKSTTIKCILGLLDYSGVIAVAGLDCTRDGKAVRRLIGYVPQELHFYGDWTVARTMNFYADLKRASRVEIRPLLDEVGLEAHAAKAVNALSGGLKQRLALAVALLGGPELLLLDEFTASLDAGARAGLLELLWRQRRKGLTVLFTTHRADEVEALADRVEVMHAGEIAASLSVQEFLERVVAGGRTEAGEDLYRFFTVNGAGAPAAFSEISGK